MAANSSSADAQAMFLNVRAYDIYRAITTVLTAAACLVAVGAIVRGRLWRKLPQHILTATICLGTFVYSNAHPLSTYLGVIAARQTLEPSMMLFSILNISKIIIDALFTYLIDLFFTPLVHNIFPYRLWPFFFRY